MQRVCDSKTATKSVNTRLGEPTLSAANVQARQRSLLLCRNPLELQRPFNHWRSVTVGPNVDDY